MSTFAKSLLESLHPPGRHNSAHSFSLLHTLIQMLNPSGPIIWSAHSAKLPVVVPHRSAKTQACQLSLSATAMMDKMKRGKTTLVFWQEGNFLKKPSPFWEKKEKKKPYGYSLCPPIKYPPTPSVWRVCGVIVSSSLPPEEVNTWPLPSIKAEVSVLS